MEIIWLFNITTLYVHICYVQTFKTKHKPLWCYCERLINLVKSLKFLFFLRILAKEHKALCSVLSIMELREDDFGIALNSLKIYKPDIYIYIFCDNFLETFCFKKFQAFMLLWLHQILKTFPHKKNHLSSIWDFMLLIY